MSTNIKTASEVAPSKAVEVEVSDCNQGISCLGKAPNPISERDNTKLSQKRETRKQSVNPDDTDTEFQAVVDEPTIPLTNAIKSPNGVAKCFLHTRCPVIADDVIARMKTPHIHIDSEGLQWRWNVERSRYTYHTPTHFFFSFKEPQFGFADDAVYRKCVLPELCRTRRISHQRDITIKYEGMYLQVFAACPDGVERWCNFSLKYVDISAMQGAIGLGEFAANVGLTKEKKHSYTVEEKGRMLEMLELDPIKFKEYNLGDLDLELAMQLTTDFYNKVALLIGVEPRKFWGLSTGKIVAQMVSEWIATHIGVTIEEFSVLTSQAGCEGITNLSKVLKLKNWVYLAMVDGGRAVAEREFPTGEQVPTIFKNRKVQGVFTGVLDDLDISGCYGNGLKNQDYAVGIPQFLPQPMTYGEWEKKYAKKVIPGLFVLRVSYKNAPFRQDFLISKAEKQFTSWDWGWEGDNDGFYTEDGKRVYDASMLLNTNSVHQAAFTWDAMQVMHQIGSNSEIKWLRDNMIVESGAMYLKDDEVPQVTSEMLEGVRVSEKPGMLLEGSKNWVRVSLRPLMETLLSERGKHKKKTPMNTFLKLIINTIYGCIASEFFSTESTGISNVVVGSNITARARILAWCMAKGFHSVMSVTDGGVLDVNKVLKYKKKSLNLLESLHQNNFNDPTRRDKFVEQIPLLGRELTVEEVLNRDWKNEEDTTNLHYLQHEIDSAAWEHLASEFGDLDIFKYSQFKFESKRICLGLTPHSKVDYRLNDVIAGDNAGDDYYIAMRGLPKVPDSVKPDKKVVDPRAHLIFDAVENGTPIKLELNDTELLSLEDWKMHPRKDVLTPHDTVSVTKTFYSHTPLASRFYDMQEYINVDYAYQKAKESGDAVKVCEITVKKAPIHLKKG